MPSPFTTAGAQSDPSRSAPLHTNRFFTGLWTQRSPLRDAATPYIQEKFYSASRFDSLIGGVNTEITTRLTLARRPGHTVYNSATLPPFNRLYPFRTFQNGVEVIRVIGDFQPDAANPYGSVRDVTGPSTNLVIWKKLAGSGKTSFQAVGSELFFVDGVSQRKLVTSTTAWAANYDINAGVFIVDSANNLQVSVNGGVTGASYPAFATAFDAITGDGTVTWINKGSASQAIGSPEAQAPPAVHQAPINSVIPPWVPNTWYSPLPATLTFDAHTGQNYVQILTQAGVTAAGNGPLFATTPTVPGYQPSTAPLPPPWAANTWYSPLPATRVYDAMTSQDYIYILTTAGVTQAGQGPKFNTGVMSATSGLPAWAADTWYSPLAATQVYDGPNNWFLIHILVQAGTTAATMPTFATAAGATTTDGTCVWVCQGPNMWRAKYSYPAGYVLMQSASFSNPTCTYIAITGGVSGASAPNWATGFGSITQDGAVQWENFGPEDNRLDYGGTGNTKQPQNRGVITDLLDSNNNRQTVIAPGNSGLNPTAPPTWATTQGQTTTASDSTNSQYYCTWINNGAVSTTPTTTPNAITGDGTCVWTCQGPNLWHPGTAYPVGFILLQSANAFSIPAAVYQVITAGTSGASAPNWSQGFASTTQDGGVVWRNFGPQDNRIDYGGTGANSLSQVRGFTTEILDSNGYLQAVIAPGSSGPVPPTWAFTYITLASNPNNNVYVCTWINNGSTNPPGETLDGTCIWNCQGANVWEPNTFYPAGYILGQTSTFSVVAMYQVTTSGVSGSVAPTWVVGFGTLTLDGGVVWQNYGSGDLRLDYYYSQGDNPVAQARGYTTEILDVNGYIENVVSPGQSGLRAPAWATVQGQLTTAAAGSPCTWANGGAAAAAGTGSWYYAYAWKNSVTGHVTTASPKSAAITVGAGTFIVVQGKSCTDQQYDTIEIYRTDMGGSTLFLLAEMPSPAPGKIWTYNDTSDGDSALNIEIEAQIAGTNNPPPANLSTLSYHLGRLWGFAGNVLYYSGGPDTLTGSGNEAWPPLNTFTLPSQGVLTWPTSIGLISFTDSDVYIVLGQGTVGNPLYITDFQHGVGLLSYDAFAVNGSTAYFMTTAYRLISFDPSAGETEVGFPIGDLLSEYTQARTVLAYHEGSSADTALYACDGTVGWYRMSTISAPESGMVWSPQAQPVGGCAAVASIEVLPGFKQLLVAGSNPGPILVRNAKVSADNGTAYPANAVIGSIVLAQPGQIAGIEFLTCDSIVTGTRPTLGLLLGELSGTVDWLYRNRQDPTLLPPSTTIWGDRYYMGQNQRPAWCRHMQVTIQWATEPFPNELLTYTIFGEIKNEYEVAG